MSTLAPPQAPLAWLADYVALVYHEARNVRHLIHIRAIEPGVWKYVVALPVHRDEAWRALQDVRALAREAKASTKILHIFERRFRVSMADLIALYGHQAWRNASFGGNAWARVAILVAQLAECLDSGRLDEADGFLAALRGARHNTGAVIDKLARLDRVLGL